MNIAEMVTQSALIRIVIPTSLIISAGFVPTEISEGCDISVIEIDG